MNFWHITSAINIDTIIGKKIRERLKIEHITEELVDKFGLNEDVTCIFSDGSRTERNISTECIYYIPKEEIGYMLSIGKRCLNFTAEAIAILKALQLMENQRNEKDIIIYTNTLSVIQALINNKISAYTNKYVLGIRKKYFELSKTCGKSLKDLITSISHPKMK